MKTRFVLCVSILQLVGTVALAQDSKFTPKEQQIPVPDCLKMRGLWEGGSVPCAPEEHKAWLEDISHWRKRNATFRAEYRG